MRLEPWSAVREASLYEWLRIGAAQGQLPGPLSGLPEEQAALWGM